MSSLKRWAARSRTPKSKKRVKRAPSKPQSSATNARMAVAIPRGPIPLSVRQTLKYAEYGLTFNPGAAGAVATYIFSANGCYDPNISGTGHQPRGFDQWMTMYAGFYVKASRITVKFAATGAETYNTVVGVAAVQTSSGLSDSQSYLEQELVSFNVLRPGTSGNIATCKQSADLEQFFKVKDITGDDVLGGTNAANPIKQLYYHIFGSAIEVADPQVIDLTVVIEYDVVFTSPASIPLS